MTRPRPAESPRPCRLVLDGKWCVEHNRPGDHAPELAKLLREIAGLPPRAAPVGQPLAEAQTLAVNDALLPVVLACSWCTAPILSGEAMTSIRERETVCPACALDEAAPIAVQALSVNEPDADLLTLQRASEVLTTCAGMFAASVGAATRRANEPKE